jgi:hypothetical protein
MGGSLNSFVDPSAYEGRGDRASVVSATTKDIADVVVINERELVVSSLIIVFPVVFVAARFVVTTTTGRTIGTGGEDNDVLTGTANPFAMSTAHETSKTMAQVMSRLAGVMLGCWLLSLL